MQGASGKENKAGRDLNYKVDQEAAAVVPGGLGGASRPHSPAVPSRAGVKSGAVDQLEGSRDRVKRPRSALLFFLFAPLSTCKLLRG